MYVYTYIYVYIYVYIYIYLHLAAHRGGRLGRNLIVAEELGNVANLGLELGARFMPKLDRILHLAGALDL